ncbi:hypothetical protein [Sphingomonas sp. CFBP 8760]|uniref:hypothetical protein n=1 Tax=Sphingomonas sp. CFBP 8760 TaxID=2775282 RepID=UPI00177E2B50|nr:hypothetical protein [Sphingomonas sp. CFBP 8760]MBD8548031.1 hypothetical protein [Sphingomonas sp. CFBP 8760]
MFDPVKLRALAERAAAVQADTTALHDELDAMLPLAITAESLAAIAGWPEADRECRKHLLHAMLHLSRATNSLGVATTDLGNATMGTAI